MSKVCMAAVNDNDRTYTLSRLQERFPEIPEGVISKILAQYANNMEKCLTILSQESDKYLYGESMDSPGSKNSNSIMEPLRINIPSNDTDLSREMDSFAILPQTTKTVAVPSSSGTTIFSNLSRERHHSVDDYNDYNRKVIQHQKQRLDRLRLEYEAEKIKLSRLHKFVKDKEEELINKKYRVASNPSKTHVDHLLEETQVLRTEIDNMTQVIDNINNGASLLGFVTTSQSNAENISSTPHQHPGVHTPRPPWLPPMGERPKTQSPVHDPSMDEWILLPKELISAPIPTTTIEPTPPPPPEDTEQTWQCKHCTLENHGALNSCEACERSRN
ncbi:mitogen-activated protein kinase kinase kinase 7-interacting protein 3 homolog isoform X2 [Actinia tenebrosa]|uniref:Mitogen-activated protein kinase kinase kinase 7-interacting protein 3 homolog isoform X2 n=1 Tax=Actinia tenebrosa TaxID=6105 RepID=A0A6P8HKI8_ACTTE|nr:mitogen-activated protein kinase kinase kinase 7-interacting protein 3 homolog isoform X2 [Actinia tenebrosa]